MQEISKEINYKNLIYNVTNKTSGSINCIKFKGPFGLRDGSKRRRYIIRNGRNGSRKF